MKRRVDVLNLYILSSGSIGKENLVRVIEVNPYAVDADEKRIWRCKGKLRQVEWKCESVGLTDAKKIWNVES